ncbi:hypothetical protein SteCoe_20697 [Stentor coeruleus]|uniref:Ion transport domain-containing protein n=1 Tax=Stentor coeruleus TaxID=5963 RepID=A0A1R2BRF4_9CILI|nr:hypothetical protein SteCoe_20697 [Stentor coeruleus]
MSQLSSATRSQYSSRIPESLYFSQRMTSAFEHKLISHEKKLSVDYLQNNSCSQLLPCENEGDYLYIEEELYAENNLIGLEKRKALTSNLKATSKTIRDSILKVSSELEGFIVPIRKHSFSKIDKKRDKYPLLPIRKALLRIVLSIEQLSRLIIENTLFDMFIIIVIVMNMIILSIDYGNSTIDNFNLFFLYTYTIECVLKIIGFGLIVDSKSYLRDWWNILDFTIVITSWIDVYGKSSINLTSLRVIRILRVMRILRGVSSVEGMRIIIKSLFMAFRPLTNSLIVLMIFASIFAIVGLQLWSGTFRNRCLNIDYGTFGDLCGSFTCPKEEKCAYSLSSPENGTMSFDSFFYAFLIVFQILTLEGWTQILVYTEICFNYLSLIYFFPLIITGSLLILNLTVAVVTSSFTSALKQSVESRNLSSKKTLTNIVDNHRRHKLKRKSIIPFNKLYSEVDNNETDLKAKFTIKNLMLSAYVPSTAQDTEVMKINLFSCSDSSRNQNYGTLAPTLAWRISKNYITEIYKSFSEAVVVNVKVHGMSSWEKFAINVKSKLESTSFIEFNLSAKLESETNGFYQEFENNYDAENNIKFLKEKYNEMTENEIFRFFSKKFGKKKAFSCLNISAKSLVDLICKDEKNKGVWSGFDINSNSTEKNNIFINKLNKMKICKNVAVINYNIVSMFCNQLINNKIFGYWMSLLVALNISVLASDHYGIDGKTQSALANINNVCTLIFFIELILKIVGLGITDFVRDFMNDLDFCIVILSIIEFFFEQSTGFNALRALRVLRIFRVLKVFRIFRYTSSLVLLLKVLGASLSNFAYLFMLLLLLLLIFTLLGIQIFGGTFNFPEGLPRNNFDSFQWAFVTMFQVLSSENWDTVLRLCMRSSVGHWSAIFVLFWIVIGNFIMLNLFLGILLGAFESNDEIDDNEMIKNSKEEIFRSAVSKKKKEEIAKEKALKHFIDEEEDDEIYSLSDLNMLDKSEKDNVKERVFEPLSFGILSEDIAFRKFMLKLVLSSKFEFSIVIVIILNIIKLIWDTYTLSYSNTSPSAISSSIIDSVFTTIFALEFIMKSIALGFCWGKQTYLADHWNKLDFIILILSFVDIALMSVNIAVVKVLRALRIFRPLRLIRYNISMRIILSSLFESIIASLNVVTVISVIWLIFAILGVALFNGKFYVCENPEIKSQTECESMDYKWSSLPYNYDNIFEALLTLFVVASQEGWPDHMFIAVDAYKPGYSPIENYNPLAAYFIIAYMFIGDFFMINLFTVVVYSKFVEAKQDESSLISILLTKSQQNWLEIQKNILKLRPQKHNSTENLSMFKKITNRIVSHKFFKIFIICAIIFNTLNMAIYYEGASIEYTITLDILGLICTFIFIFEALIKICALGIKGYFTSHWNSFDFFVVICSILFFALQQSVTTDIKVLRYTPQLFRVLRVMRVSKVLSLFNSMKYMNDLLNVIWFSMPAALNVLCLMLMIFVIYAILGVYMFAQVRGNALNDFFNFSNFHMAMITLWRISTGEDYPGIMRDCVDYYGNKGPSVYFTTFVTITTFILTEFFVSVIIENYQEFIENPISPVRIFNTVVKKIKMLWHKHTKKFNGQRIDCNNAHKLMVDLGPDLGIEKNFPKNKFKRLIYAMRITVDDDGYIYYNDLLYGIMRRKYSKGCFQNTENFIRKILAKEEIQVYKELKVLRDEQKCVGDVQNFCTFYEKDYTDRLIEFYYLRICFEAIKKQKNIKSEVQSIEGLDN